MHFIFVLVLVFCLINLCIAMKTVKTTPLKHLFTCFSGKTSYRFNLSPKYMRSYVTSNLNIHMYVIMYLTGIFLPSAVFFSKDNFKDKKTTMAMFSKFSKWNSVAFFWIGKSLNNISQTDRYLQFKFTVFIGNFILLGLHENNLLIFKCHTHPPLTKNEPCRIYESLFYVLFGKVFIIDVTDKPINLFISFY